MAAGGGGEANALDALLDAALDDFDAPEGATAPPQGPPSAEEGPSFREWAGTPPEDDAAGPSSAPAPAAAAQRALAFDPLSRGGRGRGGGKPPTRGGRSPAPPRAAATPAVPPAAADASGLEAEFARLAAGLAAGPGAGGAAAGVDELSAGLGRLLAELAEAGGGAGKGGKGGKGGEEGEEEEEEEAGAGTARADGAAGAPGAAGLAATLSALAAQAPSFVDTPGAPGAAGAAAAADDLLARLLGPLAGQLGDVLGGGGAPGAAGADSSAAAGRGGGGAVDSLVDALMAQMVSKDVLYEPMREIAARYPPWLAANRASLPPAELADYVAQLEYVRQIVAAYEEAPGDAPRLMALLQGMQARGQPPAEIVDALAPGLGGGGVAGGGAGGLPPECCVQ